jgi:hypothetical protein
MNILHPATQWPPSVTTADPCQALPRLARPRQREPGGCPSRKSRSPELESPVPQSSESALPRRRSSLKEAEVHAFPPTLLPTLDRDRSTPHVEEQLTPGSTVRTHRDALSCSRCHCGADTGVPSPAVAHCFPAGRWRIRRESNHTAREEFGWNQSSKSFKFPLGLILPLATVYSSITPPLGDWCNR